MFDFTKVTQSQPVQQLNIQGEQVNSETTPPGRSIFEQFKDKFITPALQDLKECGESLIAQGDYEYKNNYTSYVRTTFREDEEGKYTPDQILPVLQMGIGAILVSVAQWGNDTPQSNENNLALNHASELFIKEEI